VLRRHLNGVIRADLVVPQGFATINYDTQSLPAISTVGDRTNNSNTFVIPATVSISLIGMTGSPTMIHLHGSAARGLVGPPLVWLCHKGNCPPTLSIPNAGSVISFPTPNSYSAVFTNVALPLALVSGRSTYLNVHTVANPGGEVRGQICPQLSFPVTGNEVTKAFSFSVYQENSRVMFSYTANSQQQLPPSFILSCAKASFNVTFEPNERPNIVAFSDITISGGLTGPLTAVHIHGPCSNSEPCDAPVIYFICGAPAAPCPQGTNPTIPGFNLDQGQTLASADGSLLIGFLAEVLAGSNLYYVNFHTDKYATPFIIRS
jgi:hypothetical protein